jgi:hypothetical protein
MGQRYPDPAGGVAQPTVTLRERCVNRLLKLVEQSQGLWVGEGQELHQNALPALSGAS